MGLVNPTQSSPGEIIKASNVNTPANQIAAVLNGNIDSANLADNAVTTNKIADNSVTSGKLAQQAWLTSTPTVTSGGGALTTTSATLRYIQFGKTVHYMANITITTAGTGTGGVFFTLPVAAQGTVGSIGSGREDAVSGKQLQVKLNASATQAAAFNYDNTSPIANGSVLRVSGTYEAA